MKSKWVWAVVIGVLGVALYVTLAAAAPASATPPDPNSRDPVMRIRPAPEPAMIAPAASHAGKGRVVVITERSGLDRSDASISAADGLALAMLGVGGGLVVSQRRGRTRHGAS